VYNPFYKNGGTVMRKVFHKIYLTTQVLVLVVGALLFFRVIYISFDLLDGTVTNAENCANLAMNKDTALRSVALEHSILWNEALEGYIRVSSNENYKAMKKEADRITKACKNYLAVDVSQETGEVFVFIVKNGKYKNPWSWEALLYSLGFVLGGTALLSALLFIIRKWIGFIFKPEKSA